MINYSRLKRPRVTILTIAALGLTLGCRTPLNYHNHCNPHCFGYRSTCWGPWPQECTTCPSYAAAGLTPPAETLAPTQAEPEMETAEPEQAIPEAKAVEPAPAEALPVEDAPRPKTQGTSLESPSETDSAALEENAPEEISSEDDPIRITAAKDRTLMKLPTASYGSAEPPTLFMQTPQASEPMSEPAAELVAPEREELVAEATDAPAVAQEVELQPAAPPEQVAVETEPEAVAEEVPLTSAPTEEEVAASTRETQTISDDSEETAPEPTPVAPRRPRSSMFTLHDGGEQQVRPVTPEPPITVAPVTGKKSNGLGNYQSSYGATRVSDQPQVSQRPIPMNARPQVRGMQAGPVGTYGTAPGNDGNTFGTKPGFRR